MYIYVYACNVILGQPLLTIMHRAACLLFAVHVRDHLPWENNRAPTLIMAHSMQEDKTDHQHRM